jgi:5'(3')-deoxyribonucleotidase
MIFLDVDGVLADFAGAAARLHGRTQPLDSWWPRGAYSMAAVLNISGDEFWAPINAAGSDFWRDLEVLPHFEAMIAALHPRRFTLLTSPSREPSCLQGKLEWIHKVFGSKFRDYVITPRKHLLAHPLCGAILIDDLPSNCHDFEMAGGEAILFPTLYNKEHRYWDRPVGRVAEWLALDE